MEEHWYYFQRDKLSWKPSSLSKSCDSLFRVKGICLHKEQEKGGRGWSARAKSLLWEKYVCYAWLDWWQDLWASALLLSRHWTWVILGKWAGVSTLPKISSVYVWENTQTHNYLLPTPTQPAPLPCDSALSQLSTPGLSRNLSLSVNFNLALLGKQRWARTRRAISLSRCPPVLQEGLEETEKGAVGWIERDWDIVGLA